MIESRRANPNLQFRLRTLFVLSTFCALVFALHRIGGIAAVRAALGTGILLGLPVAYLAKNKLRTLSLAVSGAVLATFLGICFLDVDIESLNDSSPDAKAAIGSDDLAWWTIIGALLVPAVVVTRGHIASESD